MVSPFTIPISHADMATMTSFIQAILKLSHTLSYPALVGSSGLLHGDSPIIGFDFYLTPTGPKLIEVNTNPAGLLLSFLLAQFHGQICDTALPSLEAVFCAAIARHSVTKSPMIVILDESPTTQYTYFEFSWFKALFEQWGVECVILSPRDLILREDGYLATIDGRIVSVIYNRYCDFLLENLASAHLGHAFLSGKVHLLPSPDHYRLLSDKSRLAQWSEPRFLSQFPLSNEEISVIRQVVPPVFLIDDDSVDLAWARRKHLFFKPANSFGSKGVYRGKSISRPAFDRLIESPTIAQPYFTAPVYTQHYDGHDLSFKYDIRVYVVNGEIVLTSARLFMGQVTNLQTPYGGFAPVTLF